MADVVKIVNKGLDLQTALLAASNIKYMGWGTGTTPTSTSDTALEVEVDSRIAGTQSQQTTVVTNDTYRVVAENVAGAPRAITELGLLDAISGGNLYLRGTFLVINLNTGEKIEFIINVQQANAS